MSKQVSAELIASLRMAADICVFTSGYPPGACCIGVAGTVAATLQYYDVDARVVAGGLCYRAGPHPKWDVAAFCGADNRADTERRLFHTWVETRDRSNGARWLLDFTPKYWADDPLPSPRFHPAWPSAAAANQLVGQAARRADRPDERLCLSAVPGRAHSPARQDDHRAMFAHDGNRPRAAREDADHEDRAEGAGRMTGAPLLSDHCSGCGRTGIWNASPLFSRLHHDPRVAVLMAVPASDVAGRERGRWLTPAVLS
jgi:hypothetical protein